MDETKYTETITVKVTDKQKEYLKKQKPNMSEWLRDCINREMKKDESGGEPLQAEMVNW